MKEAVNRLILEEEPGNTECDKDENIIAPFLLSRMMAHDKSEEIHQKLESFLLYLWELVRYLTS